VLLKLSDRSQVSSCSNLADSLKRITEEIDHCLPRTLFSFGIVGAAMREVATSVRIGKAVNCSAIDD